jgi:hypothetical protein
MSGVSGAGLAAVTGALIEAVRESRAVADDRALVNAG